jgi:son of sevenless-like protein
MTFRTFTTPDVLFDMLVEQYELAQPANLTMAEIQEWQERRMRPVQERVLTVLTTWLEDHWLLEEEPHIAGRLASFLKQIVAPTSLVLTAQLMLKDLERLVRPLLFNISCPRLAVLADIRSPQ